MAPEVDHRHLHDDDDDDDDDGDDDDDDDGGIMMMVMMLANIEVRRKCELGGETSPISFPSLCSGH